MDSPPSKGELLAGYYFVSPAYCCCCRLPVVPLRCGFLFGFSLFGFCPAVVKRFVRY